MAENLFGAPTGDDVFELEGLDQIESKFLVPNGEYRLRCVDIEREVSKSSNNPMWTWTFVIVDGPHGGKEFKMWTALTAGALWKLEQTVVALGVHSAGASRLRFSKSDVIGKQCIGVFKQEEYQGRMGSKIDMLKPLP